MGEGGVTNYRYGGMGTCVGRTLGHRDGGTHIYATVDAPERGKGTESVATYITEDACVFVLSSHLVQCIIYIAVSAALA